jgi:hydroxypyruvate isomerase
LSDELLDAIEAAESEAERIRAEAEIKANEIISAARESCRAQEHEAAGETRLSVRRALDRARAVTEEEIHAMELRRSLERDAMRELALNRVELAATFIMEKVACHGGC